MVSPDIVRQIIGLTLLSLVLVIGRGSSAFAGEQCPQLWVAGVGQPGMSHSVQSAFVYDDGTTGGPVLYAGGAFTMAGDTVANRIARWDRQEWSQVGSGLNNVVKAMIAFDAGDGESLYATGDFTASGATTTNYVARWNGTQWVPTGSGLGGPGLAFAVFDDGSGDRLFVGGNFIEDGDGSIARRIAVWTGVRWQEVVGGVLGGAGTSVQALAVFDDGNGPALYIGGNFGFVGGNNPFNNIVRWDGKKLSDVGDGVTGGSGGNIQAMAVFDDGSGPALYVGGLFTHAGAQNIPYLARWDGTTWSSVGSGISAGILGVQDIVADHEAGKLYITGLISSAGGVPVNNIAVWDGESWSALGTGLTGGVFPAGDALAIGDIGNGRSLFVGGLFSSAGGMTANRIAELSLDGSPSITQQPQDESVYIGQAASFTVQAVGATSYQWHFDEQPLSDGNGVSGSTTATLEIQAVTLDHAGFYDVVVGNDCGQVISTAAELSVTPKPGDLNGDGVVDGADLLMLLSAWGKCADPDNCPADLNGDGTVDGADLLTLLSNWG